MKKINKWTLLIVGISLILVIIATVILLTMFYRAIFTENTLMITISVTSVIVLVIGGYLLFVGVKK